MYRSENDSRTTHRGNLISRALNVLDWLHQRRLEFSAMDFAKGVEINQSTAYVWLTELEKQGLIEHRSERKGLGPPAYMMGKSSYQSHKRFYRSTLTWRK